MPNRTALQIFVALLGINMPVAFAQNYPVKPVRLIVPSAPGGGTDIAARLIAQGLTESLGQAVVVDNRGGAGGIAGVTVAAKLSAPDGYTLLLGSNGHLSFAAAINPKLPYDPQKDLTPISLVANQPFVLAVSSAVAANSIRELITMAKAKPGVITYGSGGAGSASHLGVELFQLRSGVTLMHIPYKGTGPGMSALMSGELQVLMAGLATVLPQAKSGKIKVLAVSGSQRSRMAPEVPTVAEAGVPGYEFNVWYGMMAPGGTPRPIVTKLATEIARLLKAPVVVERFAVAGLEPISNTPDEFTALLKREIPEWNKVAKAANIRVE
ncbi:MAG: tripartite tricarboxylate transporter substrate binding protein [Betaproteobacteria bacterium]|jgi:tripartite-type tricarboxylate transporter receptor subunit TctC